MHRLKKRDMKCATRWRRSRCTGRRRLSSGTDDERAGDMALAGTTAGRLKMMNEHTHLRMWRSEQHGRFDASR
jgi:hypothetical protein